MWSSENERLGVKQCSPISYLLTTLAFVFFVSSGITLLIVAIMILTCLFTIGFTLRIFLVPMLPIFFLIIGLILNMTAGFLLKHKGFKYDYELNQCTWNKN